MLPVKTTKEFIYGLPKAELHLHLEGTLEPDLKLALAQKNKVDIGQTTIEEIKASYEFDSLPSFLNVYYPAMNVLQTEEDFYALAWAYLEKAQAHNIQYCELFFDPQAHTSRGVAFETVINGYYRAISESDKLGIKSALIMCFLRDFSAESAAETLAQALPFKDKIIGIGLDSDEKGNPPAKFAEVFAKGREAGFKLTMHCDIDQENSIEHIRQVLHEIKVDRIDHGTNIVENQELVDFANEHQIGLTSCPVSNSFVVDDMKGTEIVTLLEQGVKVTVNSDDPAYFQSYLSDDLFALSEKYHLTPAQVVRLVKNAFEIAWTDQATINHYLNAVDQFVADYQSK